MSQEGAALIAPLIEGAAGEDLSRVDRGSIPTHGMRFFRAALPFSSELYLGVCEDLNAHTCNDPMQRWGNNEEGRWSSPR